MLTRKQIYRRIVLRNRGYSNVKKCVNFCNIVNVKLVDRYKDKDLFWYTQYEIKEFYSEYLEETKK